MAGMLKGALLVWMDVEMGHQDDFDAWYNRQHLFERIAVPGFLTGRRWQAVRGSPRFLATYDTVAPEALQGEEYRRRLENPTPWTLRVMPRFRNTIRGVCAITARRGSGAGGCIATLRLSPAASQREPLRQWLSSQGLGQIAELPGIVTAYLCEAVQPGASRSRTAEQELRKEPDRERGLGNPHRRHSGGCRGRRGRPPAIRREGIRRGRGLGSGTGRVPLSVRSSADGCRALLIHPIHWQDAMVPLGRAAPGASRRECAGWRLAAAKRRGMNSAIPQPACSRYPPERRNFWKA